MAKTASRVPGTNTRWRIHRVGSFPVEEFLWNTTPLFFLHYIFLHTPRLIEKRRDDRENFFLKIQIDILELFSDV